ncbi:FkbM family methyltransferase [Novosphingobium lentum]|uniref:FkbM family methyltransferase n=1 Tax=Novosphingobium lentum TaxID=145287 RepID=UPI000A71AEC0|nr:FkbM family methyltransferase [Novosphingobium lentum]
MLPVVNQPASEGLVVYGLGSVGQGIVDDLLAGGTAVDLILDRGKRGQSYRDIPVLSLDDAADGRLADRTVLIGLHNHYVDIKQIHGELVEAGAARVLTPVNLPDLAPDALTRPGYWLDKDFDYAAHKPDFARVRALLADEVSRALFDAIVAYRQSGDVADCPAPSLEDEYTPADLPRLAEPLRIVDCGAFTGVAIHKFLKAGYAIDSFVAFEPDAGNFATLASRDFNIGRRLCLPLGTWSSTCQLHFSSDGSMASRLSDAGDTVIQCVAVDDVLHGEQVNVVKLDVEGAEIETLKGMRKIIAEQKPALLVSAYHLPEHLYEIVDLIESWNLGYRFHLRTHEFNTFGTVVYAFQP